MIPFLPWLYYEELVKGTPPPFRHFLKTAHRKNLKFSGQIDLDAQSKSCARLKILRCFLLGDAGVPRAKNGPPYRPAFSAAIRPIGLKFFLQILDTVWGAYFFWFLSSSFHSHKKTKILGAPSKMHVFLDRASFVKSAKNQRYNIFQNKKKQAPKTLSSTCIKSFSSIGCTMSEKRGRFCRFLLKNQISRKPRKKNEITLFSYKKRSFFSIFFNFKAIFEFSKRVQQIEGTQQHMKNRKNQNRKN